MAGDTDREIATILLTHFGGGNLSVPRVAIVGSRQFASLDKVIEYVKGLPVEVIIVSGGAIGVDLIAQKAAEARGMKVDIFKPDWAHLGRAAGPIRNRTIVENCDALVAFWDGVSPGTHSSIKLAQNMRKPVTIIYPNGRNHHGDSRKDQRHSIESGEI